MRKILAILLLILVNSVYTQPLFYGLSGGGGPYFNGYIFKLDAGSGDISVKYQYDKDIGDSPSYIGPIVRNNGKIYGLVYDGDINGNFYYVYEFDPEMETYTELCKVQSGYPYTCPETGITFAENGNIYGTCQYDQQNYWGLLFKYDFQTNEHTVVHDFQNNPDGQRPMGNLYCASDGLLYGVTRDGGSQGQGTIYAIDPANDQYTKLYDFDVTNGRSPESGLVEGPDQLLYGLTAKGGDHNKGVLYSFDPSTSTVVKFHDFNGWGGKTPKGRLLHISDGNLFGFTYEGGSNDEGVFFQYNIYTQVFKILLHFSASSCGSNPISELCLGSNGLIYGVTENGGSQGWGCIFEFDPETEIISIRYDFGNNTYNASVSASEDGKLYGAAYKYFYEFDIASGEYDTRFRFGSNIQGRVPRYQMIEALNGKFYGACVGGGQYDNGTIFEWEPVSGTYRKVHDFVEKGDDYMNSIEMRLTPEGNLIGISYSGGNNYSGLMFKFDPDSYGYKLLLDFNGSPAGYLPSCVPFNLGDGWYYGRTCAGGAFGGGTIYRYSFDQDTIELVYDLPASLDDYRNLVFTENGMIYGAYKRFDCGGPDPIYMFQYDPFEDEYTEIFEFTDVGDPERLTLGQNGKIYSYTRYGGDYDRGFFFEFDPETAELNILHHYNFYWDDYYAWGQVMQASNGKFYGIASNSWGGFVYEYDFENHTFTEFGTLVFYGGTTLDNPTFKLMEYQALAGVKEKENYNISIYPNPFKDHIVVNATNIYPEEFILYGMNGTEIQRGEFMSGITSQIDLPELLPGVYLLKIIGKDAVISRKIVKSN